MIQIAKIHIEEFRGIRALDINMDGKSFVVHGPNGSGKSGVVDAIGFVLTGTIARLTGTGTGGISVQKHAPHVHKRDDPGAALVEISFRDTQSGQVGTVRRSVKNPAGFTLTPDTPELRAALSLAQRHPELTLSRREIIKFILSESGKRAAEVQALLQLDALDLQRKALKSAQGKCAKDQTAASTTLGSAREAVKRHLDVPKLVTSELLNVINPRRATLGLLPLPDLTLDTNFADGIDSTSNEAPFDKPSALRDLETVESWIGDVSKIDTAASELLDAINPIATDASVLDTLSHRSFLADGITKIDDSAACPLCDLPWESPEALRFHLEEKVRLSGEAAKLESAVKSRSAALAELIQAGRMVIRIAEAQTAAWGTPEANAAAASFGEMLVALNASLRHVESAVALQEQLKAGLVAVPVELVTGITALRSAIESKPDNSAKAQARDHLVVASERWTQLRLARGASARATAAHDLATGIYEAYCTTADQALANLYDEVEGRFSEFYRYINSDDEAGFKAEMEPAAGKLDLLVDFYGLGMFPPGAYHSEGHQDGMGVCLYLALVEKLLGSNFRFAVLDDVVMSVDSNHRRQFCELLMKHFPDVQFVITTHDPIWAKQMQSSHLISRKSQVQFKGWTVDNGPASEHGSDVWGKIAEDLAVDDVSAAAHKLRRGLEAELPDLVEDLQGQVTFRGDAKYELGELLNAVKGRHSALLKKAAASANSWNLQDAKVTVDGLKAARAEAVLAQEEENWAINALVHFNEWATLSKADFLPVVDAWKEFLALFRCSNDECEGWIEVSGPSGHEESLRCPCGTYTLNLVLKGK